MSKRKLRSLIQFQSRPEIKQYRPRMLETKLITMVRENCIDEETFNNLFLSLDMETNRWETTDRIAFWRTLEGVYHASVFYRDEKWENLCRGLSITGLAKLFLSDDTDPNNNIALLSSPITPPPPVVNVVQHDTQRPLPPPPPPRPNNDQATK